MASETLDQDGRRDRSERRTCRDPGSVRFASVTTNDLTAHGRDRKEVTVSDKRNGLYKKMRRWTGREGGNSSQEIWLDGHEGRGGLNCPESNRGTYTFLS